MSEEFVPLALVLRPPPAEERADEEQAQATTVQTASPEFTAEHRAAFGAVRRFRAAIDDALEISVRRLAAEIAENVLARELALQPVDIAAIVAKARERIANERVLAVRLHPCHREALAHLEVEKLVDETLLPGDLIVELRSGSIDLRLRTRIEMALDACVTI